MIDLAHLLTGPAARAALAQRDIAAVYRILSDTGVTHAQIAQATGQHDSEVSDILAGRRVHSIALLERIMDGLGVPCGWMGLAYTAGLGPEPLKEKESESETEEERTANLLRHAEPAAPCAARVPLCLGTRTARSGRRRSHHAAPSSRQLCSGKRRTPAVEALRNRAAPH